MKDKLKINGKEVWIDVLRAFACICVLLVHAPAKYDGLIPGQFILAPANYVFMAWGVSVFFMISGALLFDKPQKLTDFYKRRFSRILIPILVWSVIYIFFDRLFIEDKNSIIEKILMIPITNQTGVLWFMYALIGIYLVAPIISIWLNSAKKHEIEIILGFWGLTLLIPYLELLSSDFTKLISPIGIFYHFYGYIGFALFGYYLRKYVDIPIISWKYFILVIIAFGFPLFVFFSGIIPINILNYSQSISAAFMACVAFIFFKGLDYKDTKVLRIILKIAEFSFGIYLCHMIFLKPLQVWLTQFHINYVIQIPLTALFVGIFSFFFVWGLSKLPKSKWLFG